MHPELPNYLEPMDIRYIPYYDLEFYDYMTKGAYTYDIYQKTILTRMPDSTRR